MHPRAEIYRKSPDVVSRKIVDEIILVPVRSKVGDVESLYTLNEVAARIWELIDGKRRVAEIRDLIVGEFEVGREKAEEDLHVLLQQFREIGAINQDLTDAG